VKALKSSDVVMYCGTNPGPSSALFCMSLAWNSEGERGKLRQRESSTR